MKQICMLPRDLRWPIKYIVYSSFLVRLSPKQFWVRKWVDYPIEFELEIFANGFSRYYGNPSVIKELV